MSRRLLSIARGPRVVAGITVCALVACQPGVERKSHDTVSQHITPPVVLDIRAERGKDPLSVTASLTATARERVSGMVLTITTPEGVRADPARAALKLELGKGQQLQVRLTAPGAGQYRIQFDIKGSAPGYITAGTREVRFLVTDGREARLLTGREVRRETRTR
ncbi:MAG TPA: hypothetical protein VFY42_02960, partial [Gemmatimonadales bacterium]|nr:hypothetical protein [Gemmatimonadales bacterium]